MYVTAKNKRKIIPKVNLDSDSPIPLHYQLSSAIMNHLRDRRVKAEAQLTSETNLAKLLKLNRNTVNKAYSRLIADNVLRRNPGERRIVVTPEFVASCRKESFPTIGLVLPDKLNTLISLNAIGPLNYISGVIDTAGDFGFATTIILLPDLDTSRDDLHKWFDGVREKLCALVYIGDRAGESHDQAFEIMLSEENIPQIGMGVESRMKHFAGVIVDVKNGMVAAFEHLISLQHRKIGLIFRHVPKRKFMQLQSYSRFSDAMEAIDRLGLENRPEWTIRDFNDMESLRKQIIAMTKLPERPTALFCHNDQLARSVIDILNSIGLNVPEDISVIGYDDDQFAVSASPALTTIHHPRYLLGKEAVRMIYEDYNGKTPIHGREMVIPANLVVRGSTGPVNINLPEFQF